MAQTIAHRPHIRRRHAVDEHYDEKTDHHLLLGNEASQRERFGGLNIGASFFGWMVAAGMAVFLTALLAAAGSAIALTQLDTINIQNSLNGVSAEGVQTVGLISGGLLLLALGIAYFAGGYVAGRMSRFDGARQGAGVWLMSILVMIVFAVLGIVLGAEFNILQAISLPYIPIGNDSFTNGGLIAGVIAAALTLLAAMLGGKAGEGYHRRVDRAAYGER